MVFFLGIILPSFPHKYCVKFVFFSLFILHYNFSYNNNVRIGRKTIRNDYNIPRNKTNVHIRNIDTPQ